MQWNEAELAKIPVEDGFHLRGHAMTRVETFVAAAFAFSITLIMISGDSIPKTIPETQQAMLAIPAFLFSGVQLIWIWYEHALWSKRYGLEDGRTILFSAFLTMMMLVYIYPMRMMASGMFAWLSDGYFPAGFSISNLQELRFLFYFSAAGFTLLGLIFWLLYRHALKQSQALKLTPYEQYLTETICQIWMVVATTGILVFSLTFLFSDRWLPYAPMFLSTLGFSIPIIHFKRNKNQPQSKSNSF